MARLRDHLRRRDAHGDGADAVRAVEDAARISAPIAAAPAAALLPAEGRRSMFAKLASGKPPGATDAIPESTSAPPPFAPGAEQGTPSATPGPTLGMGKGPFAPSAGKSLSGLSAGAGSLTQASGLASLGAAAEPDGSPFASGSEATGPFSALSFPKSADAASKQSLLAGAATKPAQGMPEKNAAAPSPAFSLSASAPAVPNAPSSSAPAPAFGAPASQAPEAATKSSPTPALQLPTKQASAAVGSGVKQAESPGSDSKDSSDEQRLKWYARQKPPKGAPALLFGPFQPGASGASPAAAVGAQPAPGGAAPRADAAQSAPEASSACGFGAPSAAAGASASALGAAPAATSFGAPAAPLAPLQ